MCPLIRQLSISMPVRCWQSSGKMILGSDCHTRYGALGTMAMGEGGPELVKQLLWIRPMISICPAWLPSI